MQITIPIVPLFACGQQSKTRSFIFVSRLLNRKNLFRHLIIGHLFAYTYIGRKQTTHNQPKCDTIPLPLFLSVFTSSISLIVIVLNARLSNSSPFSVQLIAHLNRNCFQTDKTGERLPGK